MVTIKHKQLLFLSIFFSVVVLLSGCSSGGSIEKADEAFNLYQFKLAIDLYKKAYSKTKDKKIKYDITMKMADSYKRMSEYKKQKHIIEKHRNIKIPIRLPFIMKLI